MSDVFALPLTCGDCGWEGTVADAADGPKDLSDFSKGEPIPNAACPECDWWFVVNPDPVERAAPDLLEALREIAERCQTALDEIAALTDDDTYPEDLVDAASGIAQSRDVARLAIAKAEASE